MTSERSHRRRERVCAGVLAAAALLAFSSRIPDAAERDAPPAARTVQSKPPGPERGLDARAARPRRPPSPLLQWQFLVGEWRGIGQPRRGSTRGAWRETLAWRWNFTGDTARLVGTARESRLFRSFALGWDPAKKRPVLEVVLKGGERLAFAIAGDARAFSCETTAQLPQTDVASGSVLQKNPSPSTDWVYRVDYRRRNDDRFILTLYRRSPASSSFVRVAEVAYQRLGTRLAAFDTSGPICVVTGGRGTIAVTHAGKTYYVCCSGCREAFDADPEGILQEYFESRRKQRAAQ